MNVIHIHFSPFCCSCLPLALRYCPQQTCENLYTYVTHTYIIYIYIKYISWIHNCVTKTIESRESNKYAKFLQFNFLTSLTVLWIILGRDSVVGRATHYRLDGPGIESRWRRDYPHRFRAALETVQPCIQFAPGLSWG